MHRIICLLITESLLLQLLIMTPLWGIPAVDLAQSHEEIKGCGMYLFVFLTLALDEGELSASHHNDFTYKERPLWYQLDRGLRVGELV
jgi:hypothetical protein